MSMSWTEKRRTRRRLAFPASALMALGLAGPIGPVAWAQTSNAPFLDAQHPEAGAMPPPVGDRQARRKDSPASVTQEKDDALARRRALDRTLTICRC